MIKTNCISDINYINRDLEKTKKIIIVTGCSFVFGSAAFSNDLMNSYPPRYKNGAEWSFDHYDRSTQEFILKEFPLIVEGEHYLGRGKYFECSAMFVDNSFPSILRKKYFDGKYTVVNLGQPSSGLHASIMRVILKPIRWDLVKEIILIFCPTSADRLSILVDDSNSEYKTAWPNPAPHETKSFNKIQSGFGEDIFSEKWATLNFLTNYQILLSWVKAYNAKLITFPSFNNYYNPTYIKNQMENRVIRNPQNQIIDIVKTNGLDEAHKFLVDSVKWETFIAPQGKQNFFELSYSQEKDYKPDLDHVSICGEAGGSSTKWIMNCGHPGGKAHELLADEIYKHLEETDYCRKPWNIWN